MMLIGLARLGRDAVLKYTGNDKAVTNLSLAFNYGMKEQDGSRPTQWVDAALWGERAEKLVDHLTKGTQLNVHLDDVHIETYEKRDGSEGTSLRARVVHLEFAGPKKDREERPEEPEPVRRAPQQKTGGTFDQMDDDIPFAPIGRGISGHSI